VCAWNEWFHEYNLRVVTMQTNPRSSLAIATTSGEIGFRVSTSLKGGARGLHSCSECTSQWTIVERYILARWKKSLTCARIFTRTCNTIHFVVSPVLSRYVCEWYARASDSTADFVRRILYKCVPIKQNANTFSRIRNCLGQFIIAYITFVYNLKLKTH